MTSSFGAINDCIRELHEAAMHLGSVEFRSWALEHICARVPFESACWSGGLPDALTPPHDIVVVGPARNLAGAIVDGTSAAPRVLRHRESGTGQQLQVTLTFQRGADAPPFDADERQVLGWLAAQACTAWRSGEQRHLLRHVCRPQQAAALADREGCVHTVQGNFYAALRASWPEWQGGRLPTPLRAAFKPGAVLIMRGHRWTVTPCDGLLLIAARPLGAVATLTAREKVVAAAVLDAGSQRLAATRLRISANTVRNTLARVYTKLGVRGRVELAMRFRPELLRAAVTHD